MKPRIPARFAARALPLLVSAVLVAGFMLLLPSVPPSAPAPLAPAQSRPADEEPEPRPFEFSSFGLDGAPADTGLVVIGPSAPAFGALAYEDYVLLEQEARWNMNCGLKVRETLSPYHESLSFKDYVMSLDANKGLGEPTPRLNSVTCKPNPPPAGFPLRDVIEYAEQNLRRARDLYAYLAVFGPEQTFRADLSVYQGANIKYHYAGVGGLCEKEDDFAPPLDPAHPDDPYVGPPILNWCDFKARLRQSVREEANMHLIFGQQYMAEAMGLHFSGDFVGGDAAVAREIGELRAAQHQYDQAEQVLTSGLGRVVGNGCYVSDFYTESEWALLARAIQGRETCQHHIAMRDSYMGIKSAGDAAAAKTKALAGFRSAGADGYLKLIGMAGLGATAPMGQGCAAVGARPDGAAIAEMTAAMLETRRKANEVRAGHNPFGFDVTFTPARPLIGQAGTKDVGLLEEADKAAADAVTAQGLEEAYAKQWKDDQATLNNEFKLIKAQYETAVSEKSGCAWAGDDAKWEQCVTEQKAALAECAKAVTADLPAAAADAETVGRVAAIREELRMPTGYALPITAFETCMAKPVFQQANRRGSAYRALYDLRASFIAFKNIEKQARDIDKQIQGRTDSWARVKSALIAKGEFETAARVSAATLDMISCLEPVSGDGAEAASAVTKNVACTGAGLTNIGLQAKAGAATAACDVVMEDEAAQQDIKQYLIQQSQLVVQAYGAYQEFLSNANAYDKQLDDLTGSLQDALAAHQDFAHSPANDPSFRMVLDSARINFAEAMDYATRIAYLAARRAEYEYADRLSANGFAISRIYRARTGQDVQSYLTELQKTILNLPGSKSYDNTPATIKLSVAQDLLLWNDEALAKEGFTTHDAAQAEREKRFAIWVADHTVIDPTTKAKSLQFTFSTSVLPGGVFSRVMGNAYERYWLHKIAGQTSPVKGARVNVLTKQTNAASQQVSLTQGGLVHLRSQAGCVFEYHMMSPAVLWGLDWPKNQDAEKATGVWATGINGTYPADATTPVFSSRGVSSTEWSAQLYTDVMNGSNPATQLDLSKLTDIEFFFDTTYGSRKPGDPTAADCARVDW